MAYPTYCAILLVFSTRYHEKEACIILPGIFFLALRTIFFSAADKAVSALARLIEGSLYVDKLLFITT